MLLELYPFQTELFCIARPRVRSEANFFAAFRDFGVFWGVPWEPFWYRSLLKKCFGKKVQNCPKTGHAGNYNLDLLGP